MARPDTPKFSRTGTVIAVADVVESVRLMEDDTSSFIQRWQDFLAFVTQALPQHGGRVHRSLGDGLMLEFSAAAACMHALLSMLDWMGENNRSLPPQQHMHLRIGAHLADVVEDKYDIYGPDVNLSARVATLAGPNEIVISDALRQQLAAWEGAAIEDLGVCHLKHVREPVRAFRVGPPGAAPVMAMQALGGQPSLRPRIAILPFAMEGPAGAGFNGALLADEVVSALARSDTLQVVSRAAASVPVADALPGTPQESVATYLLSGRGRALAGTFSLHAELTDALSGDVVWADTFTAGAREPASMHPQLRLQVVAAVHDAVIRHEVERASGRPLPSLEGATLLQASMGLMHRLAPVDMDQARSMLEHLGDRWRRHAGTRAWLSHLHILRVHQTTPSLAGRDAALARAHAAAAVQYDPGSALVLALDGHAALHCTRDLQTAGDRYAQALRLRNDHSLALLFQAELLAVLGDGRQAIAFADRALRTVSLEPMRHFYEAICAMVMLAANDPEAAHTLAQQSVQRNPRYLPAWRALVVALVETGRAGAARAAQEKLLGRQPSFTVDAFVAGAPLSEALAGRYGKALVQAGAPH